MSKDIRLKKGVDIKLNGVAEKSYLSVPSSDIYAARPADFHGVVPKLLVREGAKVEAGTALFYDKTNEKIRFASPVSGEVIEIRRGEKRKILEIKVRPDGKDTLKNFGSANPANLSREEIIEKMLEGCVWPFVMQLPFAVIANPLDVPKGVFISAFDSAPLAADVDFTTEGKSELFQAGVDVLAKLTTGKVHLNVNGNGSPSSVFTGAQGVQINRVSGPHPAGNVGVQIHHISPMNKGEVAWSVKPQDVIAIGKLFKDGVYDAERVIALVGSQVEKPAYVKIKQGASIKTLIDTNVKAGDNRCISGNVLTGTHIPGDGFFGYYDTELTVIPEGKEQEFLGWALPGGHKFSLSRTFLSFLSPNKSYDLNTNMNGEERALVVTGEYEKLLPMDIYPMHFIKACMIGDIELLENLGVYEVSPEDFALCEFACTSKTEIQTVVREALDMVRKECS